MNEIAMFAGAYLLAGMLVLLGILAWGFVCSLIPRKTVGLLATLGSFTLYFINFPQAVFSVQAWIYFFPWNALGLLGYAIGFLIFQMGKKTTKKKEDNKP